MYVTIDRAAIESAICNEYTASEREGWYTAECRYGVLAVCDYWYDAQDAIMNYAERDVECDEFKPMHLVMDVTTGTRWVTTNTPSCHEVVIHELTFDEQVDELFDSAVFAISNEADDRASLQLHSGDSFTDVNAVMSEVTRGLNSYGFKWYMVPTFEQARDMIECDESMVIEVTENGCHVFRG